MAIDRGTHFSSFSIILHLIPYSRYPPRGETLPPLPAAERVVQRAGRALRRDHAEGVEPREALLRAELRGPGDPRLGAAHHAARLLLDPGSSIPPLIIVVSKCGADGSGADADVVGPEILEHAQGDLTVPGEGRVDVERE